MLRILNKHNETVNIFLKNCFNILSKNNIDEIESANFNECIEKTFNISFEDHNKTHINYNAPGEWWDEFDCLTKANICYFLIIVPCYLKNELLLRNKYNSCNENLKYFLTPTDWSLRIKRSFKKMNVFFDRVLKIERNWCDQKTDYFNLINEDI